MRKAQYRSAGAVVIWIVLIVSVTAWRKGVYFEGAFDTVVIAKAALQALAVLMALALRRTAPTVHPVAGGPLLAVLAVLAVSMIGALDAGAPAASAVLAVRVVLLAATVVLLASSFPRNDVLGQMVIATGVVGAVLAVTGIGTIAGGGRLAGTLLPISPNGLIVLCAIPALAAIHRVLSGRATAGAIIAACFFSLACIATQSRTALLGMALAAVVLLLGARSLQRFVAVVLVAAVPVLFAVVTYTGLVGTLLNREGETSNFTLNSRTIAWDVVLQTPFETLQKWVGAGLSVKTVHVKGQYWNDQVLDSSWISALAQTGLIGTAVLAALVLVVLVLNLRGGSRNALPIALLVFLLIRSFLETGLLDASVTFMVFIALAATFVPPRQARDQAGEPAVSADPLRVSVPDRSYHQAV